MIRLQIGGDWHWLIYSIVGFGNLSQASALLCISAGSKGSMPSIPMFQRWKKTKALPVLLLADPVEELLLP